MSELKIGTKVKDRYILKELRGSGSFGEVWLAYDDVLGADIAIKIYNVGSQRCGYIQNRVSHYRGNISSQSSDSKLF